MVTSTMPDLQDVRQEAFNRLYTKYVLGSGKKSYHGSSIKDFDLCVYQGPNGTRCFAGELLPDDLDCKDFNGRSIADVRDETAQKAWAPYRIGRFLEELQLCHDTATDRAGLQENMQRLARMFGLTVPEGPIDPTEFR